MKTVAYRKDTTFYRETCCCCWLLLLLLLLLFVQFRRLLTDVPVACFTDDGWTAVVIDDVTGQRRELFQTTFTVTRRIEWNSADTVINDLVDMRPANKVISVNAVIRRGNYSEQFNIT